MVTMLNLKPKPVKNVSLLVPLVMLVMGILPENVLDVTPMLIVFTDKLVIPLLTDVSMLKLSVILMDP
jgi:hypothetical protein